MEKYGKKLENKNMVLTYEKKLIWLVIPINESIKI